jgi:hypothetical protein
MYALQIVHRTYMGPPDVCYFLVYPLGNTWTYETPLGPMCTNHRTSAALSRSWWQIFSINSPPLPLVPHTFFFPWYAPRLLRSFLGVLREKFIRKSVDGEFQGKGNMTVLSFGVSSVSLCCYHLVILWLSLNTNFNVVIVLFLELSTFSKSFHQRICKIVISCVACPILWSNVCVM